MNSERTNDQDVYPSADDIVGVNDVNAARTRLDGVIHRTPLDRSTTFAERSGAASVGLKLENMQRTGSFKSRGAYNTMAQLSSSERERGVVASSAGNHAQGVAFAGGLLGIDTTIVVPEVTPSAKIEATRGYGAEVLVEGDIYERSYEHALELADEEGLRFVHPFNDEEIIAGQGTVGLELLDQYPELDTVLVSIGGGGLISGIATVLKAHDPDIRVVGVQPEGAFHAKPSLERDEIHELSGVDTVAEGIADTRLLDKTFAVIRERVDDVVSVSDREMSVAVALLAERAKTVAETAGAAPLAALLSGAVDVTNEHVAVIVSGGNVNLSDHAERTRSGLMRLGRYAEARLSVADWPSGLDALTETLERHGAELEELERARRTDADDPNRTPVTIGVAGGGRDHLSTVFDALDDRDGIAVENGPLDG
ncbi:threonine dehydratase [Haladaptatus paucihalophilus DX253]|uniref:threonine ammonia-lyase n=1 Tax=Haladaptatus paucihalophilus DX253 TaxID=797209 RepID=E7QVH8_HALPU|nr:threonine ammonia-lyase [Haladaptatus paucihalophilus]EFW91500.1 threonine dehydratase [Haladaptatus paucihalophilus DX253]SHL30740.1 threonine dehydratase [Haladaptatus paucihalophilus DX253]